MINVLVLTNDGSQFGLRMLRELKTKEIPISSLVVLSQPLSYHVKLFQYVVKRTSWIEAIYFSLRAISRPLWRAQEKLGTYSDLDIPTYKSRGTNTRETEALLTRLRPDIVVLAQTGIVRENILRIPAIGTLNSHPGVLPRYRGIDCHKWAILNKEFDQIGSTVHWVNRGVDTGDILNVLKYKPHAGQTADDIEAGTEKLCALNMCEVLAQLVDGGTLEGRPQGPNDGQQYYKMPFRDERTVARLLHERGS